jgi:hypothetical protein
LVTKSGFTPHTGENAGGLQTRQQFYEWRLRYGDILLGLMKQKKPGPLANSGPGVLHLSKTKCQGAA